MSVFDPLQAPDAAQFVAFVELQLRLEDCPDVIDVGDAVIEMVGVNGVGLAEIFTIDTSSIVSEPFLSISW